MLGNVLIGFGIAGAVGLVGWIFVESARESDRKDRDIRQIHQGKFAGASYDVRHKEVTRRSYDHGIRLGRGRDRDFGTEWYTTTVKEDVTVVDFEDGSSCVFEGQRSMLYAKGTVLRVMENGHGHRWISTGNEPPIFMPMIKIAPMASTEVQ